MTDSEIEYARWCVDNNPWLFYQWYPWKKKRKEVLQLDKYECQRCKTVLHKYTKANTVHHVNHLRKRPDIALDIYYDDPATHTHKRNLISLCHDCHEAVHGYRHKDIEQTVITEERWD